MRSRRPPDGASEASGFAAALMAMLLLVSTAAIADEGCPAGSGVTSSDLWRAFSHRTEEDYLRPRGLSAGDLSPAQWAKILGHGLGRQAPHVGDDEQRRLAFACLEAGLAETLGSLSAAYGALPGGARGEDPDLVKIAREATIGFHDEEVLRLTGVGPDAAAPAVLDRELGAPAFPGAEGGYGRCRFNLHPSLFTNAHPAFQWYLIRRPMKRGGTFYDTLEADPDWGSDHPKRPENRLKPDEEILLEGSKVQILERLRELRAACR